MASCANFSKSAASGGKLIQPHSGAKATPKMCASTSDAVSRSGIGITADTGTCFRSSGISARITPSCCGDRIFCEQHGQQRRNRAL